MPQLSASTLQDLIDTMLAKRFRAAGDNKQHGYEAKPNSRLRFELGACGNRRALVRGLCLLRVRGELPAVHPHRVRQHVARAAELRAPLDTMPLTLEHKPQQEGRAKHLCKLQWCSRWVSARVQGQIEFQVRFWDPLMCHAYATKRDRDSTHRWLTAEASCVARAVFPVPGAPLSSMWPQAGTPAAVSSCKSTASAALFPNLSTHCSLQFMLVSQCIRDITSDHADGRSSTLVKHAVPM